MAPFLGSPYQIFRVKFGFETPNLVSLYFLWVTSYLPNAQVEVRNSIWRQKIGTEKPSAPPSMTTQDPGEGFFLQMQ